MSERTENSTTGSTQTVRLEIVEAGASVNDVPELLSLQPAQVFDHDNLASHATSTVNTWPQNLDGSTLQIHYHFCEMLFAWNVNPFKRDMGVAAVDSVAESSGVTRFSFTTKESLDDFLDFYALDDFVVRRIDAPRSDSFHFVELTNKFLPSDVRQFFAVYRGCMQNLTVINDERRRALINDGNRVGHAFVDHFCAREAHELRTIKLARMTLGAGHVECEK